MKTILYSPRYWVQGSRNYLPLDISDEDRAYLIEIMLRWIMCMGEMDAVDHDTDLGYARERWWHRRNRTLWGMNRQHNKPNTACGFVSGLVNNLMFGNQQHITDLQRDKLEHVSLIMSNISAEFKQIRFQIRVV